MSFNRWAAGSYDVFAVLGLLELAPEKFHPDFRNVFCSLLGHLVQHPRQAVIADMTDVPAYFSSFL